LFTRLFRTLRFSKTALRLKFIRRVNAGVLCLFR
jgi:hypothetical protein